MKRISTILFASLFGLLAYSQEPSYEMLFNVASEFIGSKFPKNNYQISSFKSIHSNEIKTMYLCNLSPEGWILLSADQRVEAVLGFSFTGAFTYPDGNPWNSNFLWINQYNDQIKEILMDKGSGTHSSWTDILLKSSTANSASQDIWVYNMIKTTWDQTNSWNRFCPADPDGPGGHTYAGCVAVSMAQALSKFKRPVNGNGTHSYYADGYGVQSVDFGSASYKWDSMGLASADNYNSLLIYHCAVSVDMEFGPDASGALLSIASSALKKYFIYSKEISQVKRYSDDQKWMDLLNDELRNGRPIIYGGDADDGTPGHAFNIDGVINSVYYHINWGWGGTNNGYYVINSFKPGGNDFTKNHSAIIHIQPYYYPTDILLSDTVVLLNVPQGSKIGVVSVTDEAVNNTYSLTVISDSLFNGESWVMDYYLNGDTLKTGRTFSATDGPTDTISITVTDKFDNFIKKKIALKLGTSPTGIYDPVSINIRDLLFYPNPASGQIYIKQRNERELISLKIYSISGILIRQIDNLSDSTIQLYGLQPGIYLFKAEMSDRSSVREKIVVY